MNEYNNSLKNYEQETETPITMGNWLLSFILLWIPLVNIVMPFIWAFGNDVPPSKRNFYRAYLIILAIFAVLYAIFIIGMIALGIMAQ